MSQTEQQWDHLPVQYQREQNPSTGLPWTVDQAWADYVAPTLAVFFVPVDGRPSQRWSAVAEYPVVVNLKRYWGQQMARGAGMLVLRAVS